MKPRTIAIDGTAASGKSTVGYQLAKNLNYLYLDTGVMYRAATLAALQAGVNIADETAVSEVAERMTLEILPPTINDDRQATVMLNGADVTWEIRQNPVNDNVSKVSSYPRVRKVMTAQQRRIAESGPVVMIGRDIGTVVLPQADLKIFVEASVEVRARRRYNECIARGETADFDEILQSMIKRDQMDREKPISPLVAAPDAVVIITDDLNQAEVLAKIERLVHASVPAR